MGCNSSKTKEKRKKDVSAPVTAEQAVEGAGEEAVYALDTTSPRAALVSELAQTTSEENAPPSEEEQRAAVEVKDGDSEPKSSTVGDRGTSAERHSETAAAVGVSDALTRAALPETERSGALKSGDEYPAETDDVSESPTRAPRSTKSRSSSQSRGQEPVQETSVGSCIEYGVESGDTEEAAEGETEVELSLPRSSPPRSPGSVRAPASVSPPAVEPSVSRTETTTPSAGESIAPPTARIASSRSSRSRRPSGHSLKDSGASSQSSSPVYRPLPKEGQLPSRASSVPDERSLTPSVASSFSAAERSSQRASERYLQRTSAYSGGTTPASQPCVPPSLVEPLHEYGTSMDDDRTAAGVVAVGVPRTVVDQFPHRPGPADVSRSHSHYESQSAFLERCRGVVSPIPYRQGYTDPTPGAVPGKYLSSTTYMPPPTAYRVVTADGAPSRLSFDPSLFAAIEASRTKLIRAYAVS